MVGLNGLEPSTFRLSAGCSNQLSYRPVRIKSFKTEYDELRTIFMIHLRICFLRKEVIHPHVPPLSLV